MVLIGRIINLIGYIFIILGLYFIFDGFLVDGILTLLNGVIAAFATHAFWDM